MPITPSEIVTYVKLGWSGISGLWKFLRRNKRNLTPQEKLEMRLKWKPHFEALLAAQRHKDIESVEVIIRDLRRMDSYPQVKVSKGISAWFRPDLIYTYERGIMVGLSWEELKIVDYDKLRFCNWGEVGDVTLMRTGFIPYESIESVDWEGDRYYSGPHIYCHFDQLQKQPYERIAFCEERKSPHSTYWLEIANYDEVRRLSKKLKVKRYP
jgi:hypothetical protein